MDDKEENLTDQSINENTEEIISPVTITANISRHFDSAKEQKETNSQENVEKNDDISEDIDVETKVSSTGTEAGIQIIIFELF